MAPVIRNSKSKYITRSQKGRALAEVCAKKEAKKPNDRAYEITTSWQIKWEKGKSQSRNEK